MEPATLERIIQAEVVAPAPLSAVWSAWTTEEGARAFFAPECRIDARPGGAYEMYFDLDAEPGKRGGEGMFILAMQPMHMLSFTWNAPPELPTVRVQMTHVVVRLTALDDANTYVFLRHDGWGHGGEWEDAYAYFVRAWQRTVLPRLRYRFDVGPVDWSNPPRFFA